MWHPYQFEWHWTIYFEGTPHLSELTLLRIKLIKAPPKIICEFVTLWGVLFCKT